MLPIEELLEATMAAADPVPLFSVAFTPGARVLVLAPHPDDFDSVAVMLKGFFDRGHEIGLAVLTASSSGVLDSFLAPASREGKERIREQEQRNALAFFGLPPSSVRFLRLPEDDAGEMILDDHCRAVVRDLFERFSPEIVSLPFGEDTNPTHRRTYRLFREMAGTWPMPLLALYHKDPKTVRIDLDCYVPFDQETADWKAEMLRFHTSQHTRNLEQRGHGLDERILSVNREIAADLAIDMPYAEGFHLELLGVKD